MTSSDNTTSTNRLESSLRTLNTKLLERLRAAEHSRNQAEHAAKSYEKRAILAEAALTHLTQTTTTTSTTTPDLSTLPQHSYSSVETGDTHPSTCREQQQQKSPLSEASTSVRVDIADDDDDDVHVGTPGSMRVSNTWDKQVQTQSNSWKSLVQQIWKHVVNLCTGFYKFVTSLFRPQTNNRSEENTPLIQ